MGFMGLGFRVYRFYGFRVWMMSLGPQDTNNIVVFGP